MLLNSLKKTAIKTTDYPLVIFSTKHGDFLAANKFLPKEQVSFEIYNTDRGDIGIIEADSFQNATVKLFCYSYSQINEVNLITAYMGEPFNKTIFLAKGDSALENKDLTFDIKHIGQVHLMAGSGFRHMNRDSINRVIESLVGYHQENTKMYTLEPLTLRSLSAIYKQMTSSLQLF